MLIESISYARLDLRLKQPYTIAYETVSKATNFILKIKTTDGKYGYGCAAPDPYITFEKPDAVEQKIDNELSALLVGKNAFSRARIMEDLKVAMPQNKSILAMVNLALFDILARRANLPLFQILGGNRTSIATSMTIGILPLAETLNETKKIVADGFTIIKLKGGLNIDEDLEKIAKIREAYGRDLKLRFDGNQGYSSKETMRFILEAKHFEIEILEQPLGIGVDLSEDEEYYDFKMPIMADESLKQLRDAFHIANDKTIDMVNIKLQKVGGIDEGLHINSVSKAANMEVMTGCLDECALGISAGLHFSLAMPNVLYADLDAHLDFIDDPFVDLFTLKGGILYPSDAPGLGPISENIDDLFKS